MIALPLPLLRTHYTTLHYTIFRSEVLVFQAPLSLPYPNITLTFITFSLPLLRIIHYTTPFLGPKSSSFKDSTLRRHDVFSFQVHCNPIYHVHLTTIQHNTTQHVYLTIDHTMPQYPISFHHITHPNLPYPNMHTCIQAQTFDLTLTYTLISTISPTFHFFSENLYGLWPSKNNIGLAPSRYRLRQLHRLRRRQVSIDRRKCCGG